MATSTAATIASTLAAAIAGVASSLGFDDSAGNVHTYLLDFEEDSKRVDYLLANVGGKPEVRAWAVWPRPRDQIVAAGGLRTRFYDVDIRAYYELGTSGSGAALLRDHVSVVQDAIMDLDIHWSETISRVIDISPLDISVISGVSEGIGKILEGNFQYTAERRRPDYA